LSTSKKVVLAFLLCFIQLTGNCQNYDSLILGKWVTIESYLRKEIENPSESRYLQYQFDLNNIVSYGTSQFELGHRSEYSINGRKLKMLNAEYKIENYDGKKIDFISTNSSNETYRVSLIRKDYFDSAWMNHQPGMRTTHYTFIGNFSLYDYIFSNADSPDEFKKNIINHYYSNVQPPRYDKYIHVKLAFKNTEEVVVLSIEGLPKLSNAASSKLKRRLENTSGYWINHKTQDLVSDTLDLTFLQRGKSALDFIVKAENHFKRAAEYFARKDYVQAMNSVNKSIALRDDNFQSYILRSLLYLYQNDLDRYCKDIIKANELTPFVSLSQIEVIEGETVQINCGSK
jgi:hypothetical protein